MASAGYYKGLLNSSLPSMTIEFWMKDSSVTPSSTFVLFENSLDGLTPSVQIGLLSGTSVKASRLIYCSSNALLPAGSASIEGVTTQNIWNHYACISNSSSNSIGAYLYNVVSMNQSTASATGTFGASSTMMTSSIGSRIDGSMKFVGFIREFRIWAEATSAYSLAMKRF
jgi:hypothetical protein